MGDFNSDTLCKNSISKSFENLILSAAIKLIGTNCPTRQAAKTSTCIDHVITTPRLIHSNVFVEKCDVCDHYGILLVIGVTAKILKSKRNYRFVKDMENPEINCEVFLWQNTYWEKRLQHDRSRKRKENVCAIFTASHEQFFSAKKQEKLLVVENTCLGKRRKLRKN